MYALLAVLLCATSSFAAEHVDDSSGERSLASPSHLSADPRVNQARELIHRGSFAAALDILRPLADQTRADMTDIRFLIGLAAVRLGERTGRSDAAQSELLDEAIAMFRAILVNRPSLMRVRLELARAFFLQGDDGLSRKHFEHVLGGNTPPAMVANIRRFLYVIRARQRWRGYVSLNIEQNDNITRGSEVQTVYIFGLPFVVNEASRPRSAVGVSVSGGSEYQTPLNTRWRWLFGVDATYTDYEDHIFDEGYLLLRSGPRWLLAQRSEVSVQGIGAQRWIGGHPHSREFGVRLNARHQLTPRFGVNGQVSRITTRYRHIPEADDTDIGYALRATYLFSPLIQGHAGGIFAEELFASGIDNHSVGANAGLSVILPKGWTVGGNVEWLRKRYGRTVPFSATRQIDRRLTFRVFLLNRGLTFFGFSPQVIVTRELQDSNAVLENYKRTRTGLRFVRQF